MPSRLCRILLPLLFLVLSVTARDAVSGAEQRPPAIRGSKSVAAAKGAIKAKTRRPRASTRTTMTGYYGRNFDEVFEDTVTSQPATRAYAFRYRSNSASATAASIRISLSLPSGTALEAYHYGTAGRMQDVPFEGGGGSVTLRPTAIGTGNQYIIVTFLDPQTTANPGAATLDFSWDAEIRWNDGIVDTLEGSSSVPMQLVSGLTVTHTVTGGSGNRALPGSIINYTVTMNSRLPANSFQLTVEIPTGLSAIPGSPPGGTVIGNFLSWVTGSGSQLTVQFSLKVKDADDLPEDLTAFVHNVSAAANRTYTSIGQGKQHTVELVRDRIKVTVGATHPEEVGPATVIRFSAEVLVDSSQSVAGSRLVVRAPIPNDSTVVRTSVSPPGRITSTAVEWTFTGQSTVNVRFQAKVVSRERLPKTTKFITATVSARATLADSTVLEGAGTHAVEITEGELQLSTIDASPNALPDVFVPAKGVVTKLAERDYTTRTRLVRNVAADGVSLLLLRVVLDAPKAARVRFELEETEELGATIGGVFPVDSLGLLDTSAEGGTRDRFTDGVSKVTVSVTSRGDERFAFALYRSPRNFDTADLTATGGRRTREVRVRAIALDNKGKTLRAEIDAPLTVVRPLVVLQHGTFDTPEGWAQFPLWRRSGNELNNFYSGATAEFPFQVARTSFQYVSASAGTAHLSARAAQLDLDRALADWRFRTESAGAQADVVCHSYGGVIIRLIAQGAVTSDPNPISMESNTFRNSRNWGHGMIHKLVTIASTHRGSSTGNHLAVLNQNGIIPGLVRRVAEQSGQPVDAGAVRDQMVLSPLLRSLRETPLPCHALIGSGLVQHNPFYEERIHTIWKADRIGGLYRSVGALYEAGLPRYDRFRRLANFGWNMNFDTLADDAQDPNYDLTVSSYSQKGRLPRRAYSDHRDLEQMANLPANSLVGRLTHGDEIGTGSGDLQPTEAVAKRVAWILRQPTTAQIFARFPATMAQPPTPTEQYYSDESRFNPNWLNRTLTGAPTNSRVRDEAQPLIAQLSGGNPLRPGNTAQVSVTWPGKTVDTAFVTWTSGIAIEQHMEQLAEGQTVVTIRTQPDHKPGPFTVTSIIKASDGTVGEASLTISVEDAGSYTRVRLVPAILKVRTFTPQPFLVYGRLANGSWRDVSRSVRLSLISANENVVRVTEDGQVEPVGIGSSEMTATIQDGPSISMTLFVEGLAITTGLLPLNRPAVIAASSESPVSFVILGTATIDAGRVDPQQVRINGRTGAVVTFRDVNGDRRQDAVLAIKPRDLGLTPGNRTIPVLASTVGGTLLSGSLTATVQ